MLAGAQVSDDVEGAAIAFARLGQVHAGTQLEVFSVADLYYSSSQVVVLVNEVNFLV